MKRTGPEKIMLLIAVMIMLFFYYLIYVYVTGLATALGATPKEALLLYAVLMGWYHLEAILQVLNKDE